MNLNIDDTALATTPAANDNHAGQPVVTVPEGRPELTYAGSGNLLLPLRFARRLTGWQPAAPVEAHATRTTVTRAPDHRRQRLQHPPLRRSKPAGARALGNGRGRAR